MNGIGLGTWLNFSGVGGMDTPILFCIFNRPDLTQRTFDAIKMQRPKQLLVVCDGPRNHVPGEFELVEQTKQVINAIDWPCELNTNFSDRNLGCKSRMSSGINWAFEQHERLIILEDDCLPNESFFRYCETLLDRYAGNDEIMMISGDNFQSQTRTAKSYYFSKWSHIWGWASWRRAWQTYDVEMESWPSVRNSKRWTEFIDSDLEYQYWISLFDRQHAGQIDTWDFPWMYACWMNRGLCAIPEKNLVSNLGFLPSATHTTDQNSALACMATYEFSEIKHPTEITRNVDADEHTWNTIFKPAESHPVNTPVKKKGWWQRIKKLAS